MAHCVDSFVDVLSAAKTGTYSGDGDDVCISDVERLRSNFHSPVSFI